MNTVKAMLSTLIMIMMTISVLARLMGAGEVTGEVIDSWQEAERVVFKLAISSQTHEGGPTLASPNTFTYAGPEKLQVTEGDIIKLRYNSDDSYGIIVKQLSLIKDVRGTVRQAYSRLWLGLLLIIIAGGGVLLFLKRRGARLS